MVGHFTWVVCGYHALLGEKYWGEIFKLSGVKRMGLICFVKVSQAYPRARGTLREVLPFEKELYMAPLKICSPSLVEVTLALLFPDAAINGAAQVHNAWAQL